MHDGSGIPLEARGRLGLPRAVAATVRGVLVEPQRFFARRSREATLLPPLALALALHATTALATLLAALVAGSPPALDALLASLPEQHAWIAWWLSPPARVLFCALAPVAFLVDLAVRAGFWWLALFVVRAHRAPFRETVRALLYTDAVEALGVLTVVPLLGGLVGLVIFLWRALLEVVALQRLHEVPLHRLVLGSLAVAALGATLCCCALVAAGSWALAALGPSWQELLPPGR